MQNIKFAWYPRGSVSLKPTPRFYQPPFVLKKQTHCFVTGLPPTTCPDSPDEKHGIAASRGASSGDLAAEAGRRSASALRRMNSFPTTTLILATGFLM